MLPRDAGFGVVITLRSALVASGMWHLRRGGRGLSQGGHRPARPASKPSRPSKWRLITGPATRERESEAPQSLSRPRRLCPRDRASQRGRLAPILLRETIAVARPQARMSRILLPLVVVMPQLLRGETEIGCLAPAPSGGGSRRACARPRRRRGPCRRRLAAFIPRHGHFRRRTGSLSAASWNAVRQLVPHAPARHRIGWSCLRCHPDQPWLRAGTRSGTAGAATASGSPASIARSPVPLHSCPRRTARRAASTGIAPRYRAACKE